MLKNLNQLGILEVVFFPKKLYDRDDIQTVNWDGYLAYMLYVL